MYGRHQDFCLRSIIVQHLTEYLKILWYKLSKSLDLDQILSNGLVFYWHSPKAVLHIVGGYLSIFTVEAGIRQGCPFSPLAFVLAVELLAIKIRHCENIKGLNSWKARNCLLESIIKIALYAGDITLFLKDEQDMQQALKIFAEFSSFPGLEINRKKSEAMWLGSKQHCPDTFFGFVWKRRLKILGVYFTCDK